MHIQHFIAELKAPNGSHHTHPAFIRDPKDEGGMIVHMLYTGHAAGTAAADAMAGNTT